MPTLLLRTPQNLPLQWVRLRTRAVAGKGQACRASCDAPVANALNPACAALPIAGRPAALAGADRPTRQISMFRFTLQGRIGRIEQVKGDATIVRLSLAADRLVEGRDGSWTKTEWLSVVSFDEKLNRDLLDALEVGQSAKLDGRIEPRKRQVGDANITDHSFVLTRFERLSKPPAKVAAKAA